MYNLKYDYFGKILGKIVDYCSFNDFKSGSRLIEQKFSSMLWFKVSQNLAEKSMIERMVYMIKHPMY